MLDFLPAAVRGVIASLLLALNTILLCSFLFIVALFKALPFAKRFSEWLMNQTHEAWISNNKAWMNLVRRTRWHLKGLEGLDYQHSYLVTSNHQSWVDIMVLQYVLNRRIRPLKFFLKQELIWVPVIGLAWWALGYPFMKRYTYYPQVVLGAAFSWGMPMAFTAETGSLPATAWLLYIANLLWTVGYDTYYAMTDRDDDLKIGVKSTAILFGEADRVNILTLQGLSQGCLLLAGARFELGGWFHLGLLAAAGCFAWEFWYTRDKDRMKCFKAFLHNHWAGLAIFVGIVADYAFR